MLSFYSQWSLLSFLFPQLYKLDRNYNLLNNIGIELQNLFLFMTSSVSIKDGLSEYDQDKNLPTNFAELMEKVGNKGKYQTVLLIIFCVLWAVTAMVLMGSPFFFLNRQFRCKQFGLLNAQCRNSVCNLQQNDWKKYLDPDEDYIQSISTEIGQYFCDDQFYLDITQSVTYFGAFVGYVVFSFLSDNFGRKKTLAISWAIATVGCYIFMFSANLPMAGIGLFMIGGGSDAAVNVCFNFFGEVVEFNTRQKYSVILQFSFPFGVIVITTAFLWIHDWQIVTLIFLVIPSTVAMIFIFIYIEETPQFLLRGSIDNSLKSLNRIGKINLGLQNILTEKDITNVMKQQQCEDQHFNKIISPIDIFRFRSLRLRSVSLCLILFSVYILYYAPSMVIDSVGFNIYVTSYVVQVCEMGTYVIALLWIQVMPRKKAGMILFSITGLCSVILLFINKPEECNFCPEAIFQLFIVAIFRSSIALYFLINYIYMVEVFPSRARALGCGIASSVGTLGSTITPIFLGIFQRNDLNANTVFAVLSLLGVGLVSLLPETLNQPLQDEIQEIKLEKQWFQQRLKD